MNSCHIHNANNGGKKMLRAFWFLIILLPLSPAAIAANANAPDTASMAGQALLSEMPPPSFFAYPGKTCPGGSTPTHGPEQALAAESGAIYCRLNKVAKVVPKRDFNGKCPPGMIEYTDSKAKPDADILWCKPAPNKTAPGATVH
jgi:hypothetical protein